MKPLTDEQSRLVATHAAYACKLARWVVRNWPQWLTDDVESFALLGLCDAASRYDGSVPFKSFAGPRIRGEIIDGCRKSFPAGVRRSESAVATEMLSTDVESDEPFVGWELEARDSFHNLTAMLPARERILVRIYYGEGLSLREAGARLGVSEAGAQAIHSRALAKIRDRLAARTQSRRSEA